jgi:hypothetical protein
MSTQVNPTPRPAAPPRFRAPAAGAGRSGNGGSGTPTVFAESMDDITGIPAFGTQIQVWNGTDFQTIAGVGDISGPSTSVAEVETTSHSTGSPHRTFIPTLIDDGELSFPDFWNPTDPTQSISSPFGLEFLFQNRIITRFRLVNTDAAHRAREFKGFVRTLGESYPVQGVCTRNVAIRITSVPVDGASPITMEPTSASALATGGPDTIEIATGGINTPWFPVPDQAWIHIVTPVAPTTGDDTVSYTVDANTAGAAARSGHILFASLGLTFNIDQAAGV